MVTEAGIYSEVRKSECYDLILSLGYNLGKNLSKNGGNDQLIKHKNTRLYLLLYTPSNYKE